MCRDAREESIRYMLKPVLMLTAYYGYNIILGLPGKFLIAQESIGRPNKARPLAVIDGFERVKVVGSAGLDLYKYHAVTLSSQNINLQVVYPEVGFTYSITLRHEVLTSYFLAPFTHPVMLCHIMFQSFSTDPMT